MKKVLKNLSASILPQLVNIITNLILPNLLITSFGSELNGLINTIKSLMSYISLVGAGIATAVTQSLYGPVAKHDHDTVKGMLHAADRMFNKYGCIYCAIAACTALIYPTCVQSSISSWKITALMLVMSISGASEFFVIGKCRSILYADQKIYVAMLIQAASQLGSLIMAVILLKCNADIVLVQFAMSFVYVLRTVFLSWYVNSSYKQLRDYRKQPPIGASTAKRKDAMVHQLSGLAVTGSQPIILTAMLGLEMTSVYGVYNIVFSGLQSICANLCTAVTPFLGREWAVEDRAGLERTFDWIELGFCLLVQVVYAVALVMILPFISLYTRGMDICYIYPEFAALFLLSSAFYIIKLPFSAMINAAGKFQETRNAAVLEGSLTVVLCILFTSRFGLCGIALASGIVQCLRCLEMMWYANTKILGRSVGRSLFRLLRAFMVILCFGWLLEQQTPVGNYGQWTLRSILCTLLALAIAAVQALIFDKRTLWELLPRKRDV